MVKRQSLIRNVMRAEARRKCRSTEILSQTRHLVWQNASDCFGSDDMKIGRHHGSAPCSDRYVIVMIALLTFRC